MTVVEVIASVAEVVVTIAVGFVFVCCALAMLEALLELVDRLVARRRPPMEPFECEPVAILRPRPRLTLLVRHDPSEGVLHPTVQLRGWSERRHGSIRLELTDEDERLRLLVCRSVAGQALHGELALPPFEPPGGASVEEALGWHWDIVVQVVGDEPFRWREHPRPMEGVNVEGELECPVA